MRAPCGGDDVDPSLLHRTCHAMGAAGTSVNSLWCWGFSLWASDGRLGDGAVRVVEAQTEVPRSRQRMPRVTTSVAIMPRPSWDSLELSCVLPTSRAGGKPAEPRWFSLGAEGWATWKTAC